MSSVFFFFFNYWNVLIYWMLTMILIKSMSNCYRPMSSGRVMYHSWNESNSCPLFAHLNKKMWSAFRWNKFSLSMYWIGTIFYYGCCFYSGFCLYKNTPRCNTIYSNRNCLPSYCYEIWTNKNTGRIQGRPDMRNHSRFKNNTQY